MPYIEPHRRTILDHDLGPLIEHIQVPGELNYVISRILSHHTDGGRYHDLSRWRAAVNDASDEFYRRVMVEFENGKCRENGDVYGAGPSVAPCEPRTVDGAPAAQSGQTPSPLPTMWQPTTLAESRREVSPGVPGRGTT